MYTRSKARDLNRYSRAAGRPGAVWSCSAGSAAVLYEGSLACKSCGAHSWQGTAANGHQIYEQIISEKTLQKDDLVTVFYGNSQTYWDT